MELIAGIQFSHQSVVFRRAALSALLFGIVGHVFLLYLQLSLFSFGARTPDMLKPDETSPPPRTAGRPFPEDSGTI
jgi:hypothetical protein